MYTTEPNNLINQTNFFSDFLYLLSLSSAVLLFFWSLLYFTRFVTNLYYDFMDEYVFFKKTLKELNNTFTRISNDIRMLNDVVSNVNNVGNRNSSANNNNFSNIITFLREMIINIQPLLPMLLPILLDIKKSTNKQCLPIAPVRPIEPITSLQNINKTTDNIANNTRNNNTELKSARPTQISLTELKKISDVELNKTPLEFELESLDSEKESNSKSDFDRHY